jgi:hypothetical protein
MRRPFLLLVLSVFLYSTLSAQRDLSSINEGSTPVHIEFFAGTNCTFLRTDASNRGNLKDVVPQFAYEGGALVRRNHDNYRRFSVQSGVQFSRHLAFGDYSYTMGLRPDQPLYGRTTHILRYDSWQVGIPLEVLIVPRKNSRIRFTAGICASFAFDARSYWLYTVFSCPMVLDSSGVYYDPSTAVTYLESGTVMFTGLFASATGSVVISVGRLFGHPVAIGLRYSYGLNKVSMEPDLIQSSASLRFHFTL